MFQVSEKQSLISSDIMIKSTLKAILGAIYMVFTNIKHRVIKNSKEHWRTTDDIENDKVENLAKMLKGESDKETLTNISEWQQRNIMFWSERWPLPNLLIYILAGEVVVWGCLQAISLILRIGQERYILEIHATVALTTIAVFLLIIGVLLKWVRKIPVLNGLKNVLPLSISTNAILENRLGVCRDYAKLTACLLQKIYRDAGTYQIFSVYAPQHQATAIMIRNRLPLYVLDRQLPVVTLDKWHDRWSTKKMKKIEGDCLESVDIKSYLSTEPDIEQLHHKMITLLNIKEETDDKASSVEIPWKKGAKLYEDNEIVDYSLAKLLEMKISNEMIKTNQITRIEISPKSDDLMFKIYFRQNK
jgi:predicted transglutaminase-like protease